MASLGSECMVFRKDTATAMVTEATCAVCIRSVSANAGSEVLRITKYAFWGILKLQIMSRETRLCQKQIEMAFF